MDYISGAISGAFGTASTIVSTVGLQKQSKAEEEAAQEAALVAREQARVSAARSRRQARRTIGRQRGAVARSGVSIEGSQVDLLTTNAYELELTALYIERFGESQARQAENRAKSIESAAKLGKAAGVLQSFVMGGQAAYNIYGAASQGRTESVAQAPTEDSPVGDAFGGGGEALA